MMRDVVWMATLVLAVTAMGCGDSSTSTSAHATGNGFAPLPTYAANIYFMNEAGWPGIADDREVDVMLVPPTTADTPEKCALFDEHTQVTLNGVAAHLDSGGGFVPGDGDLIEPTGAQCTSVLLSFPLDEVATETMQDADLEIGDGASSMKLKDALQLRELVVDGVSDGDLSAHQQPGTLPADTAAWLVRDDDSTPLASRVDDAGVLHVDVSHLAPGALLIGVDDEREVAPAVTSCAGFLSCLSLGGDMSRAVHIDL
jgi:hypothetical protein